MLESPIFPEIDRLFSFYGLELDDLGMVVGIFALIEMIIEQARMRIGNWDPTLFLTIFGTLALFGVWLAFKRGRPRHFLEDALGLLAEPDVWIGTRDCEIQPSYLIEPDGRITIAPSDGPTLSTSGGL